MRRGWARGWLYDGYTALRKRKLPLRFRGADIHPLPVGSRLRLRAQLTAVDEVAPGQVQVVIRLTVEGEGIDKPILVADSISRFGN